MKTLKFSFNSFFSTLFILGFFLLFSIPAFGQCTNAECDQILIRNRNFKPNFCIDENIEIRLRNNTGGDCSDHYYIYIDDNNNSSYDVGEEIPLGSGSSDEILPSDLTQGGGIRQDYLIPITTINGILSTPLSGLEDLVNVTISLAVFSNGTYVCDGSVDQSFAITISNPPSITIPQAQEITCLNPFEILSINGLVNSSTDYTYVWVGPNITTGNNSGTPQINGSGDYFVTVTSDISGCTATATTTVLENTDAPTANINTTSSNDIITCSDLSVTLDASNSSVANSSTGTLSYLWSTGETTSMISVSTEDTYSVTITDSFNGCVDIASEIITENKDAPTANINITPSDGVITCSDSSVTLDASSSFVANSSTGVLSYLWSTGETTSMIFVSAEDTYSVTVTDSFNGCVDITSEIIVENSISPNITIPQAQDITCSNPFVTLSINGLVNPSTDYTYAWIGPDIIAGDNSGTPQINGPGDYSVTVTSNVNGCTATGTTTVIENTDTPTASVNTIPSNGKITCNDLSVTLNASSSSLANSSTGTLSYLWSTGEITSIISVSTASTYYVTVTDSSNGCTDVISQIITENKALPDSSFDPTIDSQLKCNNLNIILSCPNANSNAIYSWSNGSTDPTITISDLDVTYGGAETYDVTVTNPNGCSSSNSITITSIVQNPTVSLSLPATDDFISCATESVRISSSVSGHGSDFSYEWSSDDSSPNDSSLDVISGGTYTITVTDNSNGCVIKETIVVQENENPPTAVALWSATTITCSSGSLTLDATGSATDTSSFGTLIYTLSSDGGYSVTNTTGIFGIAAGTEILNDGNYTLIVEDTYNGCTDELSQLITTSTGFPDVNITPNDKRIICGETDITLNATSNPDYNYTWKDNNGATLPNGTGLGDSFSSYTFTSANTYLLEVENTANSCVALIPFDVLIDQSSPGVISAGSNYQIDCTPGSSETLEVLVNSNSIGNTNSFDYVWSTGETSSSITVGLAGDYTVTVTDINNNCPQILTIPVTSNQDLPSPTITSLLGGTEFNCNTNTIVLEASATDGVGDGLSNLSYQWSDGGVSNDNALSILILSATEGAGTYSVTVTNGDNQCASATSISIDSNYTTPVVANILDETLNCFNNGVVTLDGSTSTTTSAGGLSFLWSNGETTDSIIVTSTGTYSLVVTDLESGCTDDIDVNVFLNNTTPLPLVATPEIITCTNSFVQLDASGSTNPNNTSMSYNWSGPSINSIVNGENTANPTVIEGGTYNVIITDDSNGCSASSFAEVPQNTNIPNLTIAKVEVSGTTPDDGILCVGDNLTLSATTNADTYSWTTTAVLNLGAGNDNIPNPSIFDVSTDNSGVYTLEVTDTNTGCTATESIEIVVNSNPQAVITIPDGDVLDCTNNESITLGSAGSTTNGGGMAIYQWSGGSSPNSSMTEITSPGDYVLEIEGQTSACISAPVSVNISLNDTQPIPAIASPGTVTCEIPNVMLMVSNTNDNSSTNLSYNWSTSGGNIVSGGNTSQPTVNQGGTYSVIITDNVNGCSANASVVVPQDTNIPNLSITAVETSGTTSDDGVLCVGDNLTLSATTNADTYSWTTTAVLNLGVGNDTIANPVISNISTDNSGIYTVVVTDTNTGCVVTESIEIIVNSNPQAVITTPDGDVLNCTNSESITLGSAGSTTNGGGAIIYQWSGGSSPNSSMTDISSPGDYVLEIEGQTSGCVSASVSVNILLNDTQPIPAIASPGTVTCEIPDVVLSVSNTNSNSSTNLSYDWSTIDGNIVSGENTSQPTINQGGTYNVMVTDNINGCSAGASVFVPQDTDIPSLSIAAVETSGTTSDDGVLCVGDNLTLSATTTADTYSWTTTANLILGVGNDTIANPVISDVSTDNSGVYTVVVTDTNTGCSVTESIEIIVNSNPQAAITTPDGDVLDCTNNESITLGSAGSTTNGGGAIIYQWSGGSSPNSSTTEITSPGDYILEVEGETSGCVSAAVSVNISLNDTQPIPAIASPGTVTCEIPNVMLMVSNTNNNSSTNLSYNWSTSNGNIVSGGNTSQPTVNQGGTYNVIITDNDNGCSANASVFVPQDTDIPNLSITAVETSGTTSDDGILCVGDNLTLSATTTADTYSWTTTAVLNLGVGNDTIANPVISNISTDNSGIYTVVVTDTNTGCVVTESIEIIVNSNPQAVITIPDGDVLNCTNSESITLGSAGSTTNGGGTAIYEWSGGSSPNSSMTEITSPGDYILEVEGQTSACVSTPVSVNISLNDTQPIPAIASPGTVTCEIPDVVLSVSNTNANSSTNLSYDWSTSGGNIVSGGNTNQPTVNQGGTYNVTITDNVNGCSASASVFVPQDTDIPSLSIAAVETSGTISDDGVLCVGDNLTLSATTTADTYSWTTTANLILGVGNDTIANPVISDVSTDNSGIYTVVVTDTNTGCSVTESIEIIVNSNPQAVITTTDGDVLDCTNSESITLGSAGSTTNGGGAIIYEWSGGSSPNSSTTEITSPGDYILEVEGQSSGCVSAAVSVNILLNDTQPIPAIASPGTVTCQIPNIMLSVSNTNANSSTNLSYDWSTSNGNIVSGGNTSQPTVNQGGTYNVMITDNDNGCSASASVVVPQDTNIPSLSITAVETSGITSDDGILCVGDNLTLSTTTTADIYSWTTTAVLNLINDDIANPFIQNVSTDNSGIYTVVVTDTNTGCSVTESIEIVVNSNPEAVITTPDGDVLDCMNSESITLGSAGSTTNGGGAIIYEWSGGSSPNSSMTEIISPGDYILEVEGQSSGCVSESASVNISLNDTQPIPAIASPGIITCEIPNIMLSVSNTNANSSTNLSYDWSTSDGNIMNGGNTNQPTVNQAGTYNVTITDIVNGCSASASTQVSQDVNIPSLTVAAVETSGTTPDDGILCVGDNLTLSTTTTADTYSWTTTANLNLINDDIANPSIPYVSADNSGIYTVVVTDTNTGCSVTESIEIIVNPLPEPMILVPSIIEEGTAYTFSCNYCDSGEAYNYNYNWNFGSGALPSSLTDSMPSVSYSGQGGVLISLEVTDIGNACSNLMTEEVEIEIPTNCSLSLPNFPAICVGEPLDFSFSFEGSLTGGGPDLSPNVESSTIWNFGSAANQQVVNGDNDPTISFNEAGVYNITVETRDGQGCIASNHIDITVNPLPVIPAILMDSVNISCATDNQTFEIQFPIEAGTAPFTIDAEYEQGGNITGLTSQMLSSAPFNYISESTIPNGAKVTFVVTDSNGCTTNISQTIFCNCGDAPTVEILGNNAACKDEFNEGTYYQAIINDVLGQGIDSIRWDITGGKFIKLIDGTTLNGLQGVGTLTVLGADLDSLGGDEYRHSVYIKFESTAEITVSVYDEGQCLNNDNTVPSFTKMVDVLGDVNPDDDLFVLLKIDTDGLDDLVMFYPKMGLSYKWGRSPITDIPNLEDSSEFLKEVFPTGTTSSFQQYFHFGETVTVLDLDTTAYVYWVDVAESESENTEIGCRKRVYYNGPLAFRTVTETNTVVDEFSLKIIPNPNKGEFKVQVESEILGHHNVEIFDCLGRKIHESSFDKELINQEVRMSLSVAKGMYLVKVSDTEGNRETIKILVK